MKNIRIAVSIIATERKIKPASIIIDSILMLLTLLRRKNGKIVLLNNV
jgi:hypothetical protein